MQKLESINFFCFTLLAWGETEYQLRLWESGTQMTWDSTEALGIWGFGEALGIQLRLWESEKQVELWEFKVKAEALLWKSASTLRSWELGECLEIGQRIRESGYHGSLCLSWIWCWWKVQFVVYLQYCR